MDNTKGFIIAFIIFIAALIFKYCVMPADIPIGVTYTGDCNSTCYVTAGKYNVTLKEGVIKTLYDNNSFQWLRSESAMSGANLGDIYCGAWRMGADIDSNCTITESSNMTLVKCKNSYAQNNWTFRETYIELISSCTADFRVYHYVNDSQNTSYVWNGTEKKDGTGWTAWSSSTGIAGFTHKDNTTSNDILIIDWDESVKTSFDYQANNTGTNNWGAIAIGRSSQITAGLVMTQYIKVLPKNLSSTGDQQVVTVLNAFSADHTYGDDTGEIDIVNPTVNMISTNTSTNDLTPTITFNFTDSSSSTASCTLYYMKIS